MDPLPGHVGRGVSRHRRPVIGERSQVLAITGAVDQLLVAHRGDINPRAVQTADAAVAVQTGRWPTDQIAQRVRQD